MVILSLAVRFMHYALFDSKFLSLHYYLVDYAVCLGFGLLGFRLTRVAQMVTRYSWINERAGLLRLAPPRRYDSRGRAQNPGDFSSVCGLNRVTRPARATATRVSPASHPGETL